MLRFWGRLTANLDSVAGIRAAGVGTDLPWTGYDDNIGGFTIEGKKPPADQEFQARYHVASPGYFRAHWAFRWCAAGSSPAGDDMKAPLAMIVNQQHGAALLAERRRGGQANHVRRPSQGEGLDDHRRHRGRRQG